MSRLESAAQPSNCPSISVLPGRAPNSLSRSSGSALYQRVCHFLCNAPPALCVLTTIFIIAVSSWLLPKLIGLSRANSLLLTGEVVGPNHPHISALYHQVLPTREAVYPAAKALATQLAATTGQVAVAYAKGLLHHPGDSVEENHLLDSRAMKLLASAHDGGEGVKAFMEKRKAKLTDTLSKHSSPWYPWVCRLVIHSRVGR